MEPAAIADLDLPYWLGIVLTLTLPRGKRNRVLRQPEVRVVVDPYSRQAFLAVGKTIRGIISF